MAMTTRLLHLVARILVLAISLAASPAGADERSYPLADRGRFQLDVPAAWKDEVQRPRPDLPPTLRFTPRQGAAFEVLVTPIWRMRADAPPVTKETLRQSVEQSIGPVRSSAVEKTIPVLELNGASGPGYYFKVTDRASKPDEYKYMSQGMLKVAELTVTFTILTNDGQEAVAKEALAMLAGARHAQP